MMILMKLVVKSKLFIIKDVPLFILIPSYPNF